MNHQSSKLLKPVPRLFIFNFLLFLFFDQKQTNVLIEKNIRRMRDPPHKVQT